jgi:hypothetical protein
MIWATDWANFSQTHLVALHGGDIASAIGTKDPGSKTGRV